MAKSQFCSNFSKESGEPIAGSAPFAKHFIFISWPKKYWGYEALEAKGGFSKGLKSWIEKNSKVFGKITIRLVNREGIKNDFSDIFIYPGKYVYQKVCPNNIIEILDSHFQQNFEKNNFSKKLINDQIFVCTHGRHDKCCAKYGQRVVEQMRDHVVKNNLNIDIWESSHLGGHRFAATLIDFPRGLSYGRLTPDKIPSYFLYRKANKIFMPAYRGSVFLAELEKIAEANILNYCFNKKWSCMVEVKKIDKISEKEFKCIAKLNPIKGFEKIQKYSHIESTFNFFLKEYKNPSGCDSINVNELRKCWKMRTPVNI